MSNFYVLALSVMVFLGNSLVNLILVIAFFTFAPSARLIRTEVLAIKDREFIQICRINGKSAVRILFGHIVPLLRNTIAVIFTTSVAQAVLMESSLSFRSLSPVEKIKTHISHIAKIKRQQPEPERLDMLFDAVQLKKHEALNKYPHEFSGGELQRLAVARALAGNPQVLILDEPTSALDVITQKQLLDDMLPLLKDKTVLLISHDTRVIGYCADETLTLHKSRRQYVHGWTGYKHLQVLFYKTCPLPMYKDVHR